MVMVAKVILQRIWRSGIVSVAVLVGLGSVGSGNMNARPHQPERKVMALVPLVTSQQLVKRSYPEGNRTLTSASQATSGNVYSQFRRGTSNPRAQPPVSQPASGGNQKVFQAKIKRRAGGTPVIDVVFNGNKTFEMIVDTGASGTLITQRMATALGVRQVSTGRAGIADGSIVEFPIGLVGSIRVGGAVIQNVEVAIAKQMEIGLLGHDFFGNYDVKIKKDVVEFYVR
jgi:predicted aspartyl protease